jgi:hypothetical protein
VSEPDPFIGAGVYMPHGDWTEIAKVLGRNVDQMVITLDVLMQTQFLIRDSS